MSIKSIRAEKAMQSMKQKKELSTVAKDLMKSIIFPLILTMDLKSLLQLTKASI